MKSGLEGRNNLLNGFDSVGGVHVSMKSGLEGRNNAALQDADARVEQVSMKSGLEGRNNRIKGRTIITQTRRSQ